jgi:hypothetical protein
MTLHAPSRTSSARRSVAPGRPTIGRPLAPSLLLQDSSPLRRSQPEQSTSRFDVFPRVRPPALTDGRARSGHPRSRSGDSADPRRGGPAPLRSASVVFHDPGGFLLLGPCGVFRPLTPLGFGSRLPAASSARSSRRPTFAVLAAREAHRGACPDRRGGRVLAREVPGRARDRWSPRRPPASRVTAPTSEEAGPAPAPRHDTDRLRVPTAEAVGRLDRRSRSITTEVVIPPGHRVGEPPRPFGPVPCGGCSSRPFRPRHRGVPGHDRSRRGRVRAWATPRGDLASNPPALPAAPPLDGVAVRGCQLGPFGPLPIPRGRSRVAGAAGDEDSIQL